MQGAQEGAAQQGRGTQCLYLPEGVRNRANRARPEEIWRTHQTRMVYKCSLILDRVKNHISLSKKNKT